MKMLVAIVWGSR